MLTRALILGLATIAPTATLAGSNTTLESIRLSGSEHMMLHYLGGERMPSEAHAARAQLLQRMALTGPRGSIGDKGLKFSPVLTFDDNINGGFANDTLVISGLPLRIDSEYKAVGGVMVGGGASGLLRMNIGTGTALSLRGGASVSYALENSMLKAGSGGSACIETMLDGSTFAHGCLDASFQHVELGDTSQISARLGVDKAFSSALGVHEFGAEIQTARIGGGTDYTQKSAIFSLSTAFQDQPMAIRASLQFGEKVEGVLSMREKLTVGASFKVADRPTSVSVSVQNNRGGQFLGEDLSTRATSLSVNHQLNKNLTLGARVTRTTSSADFLEDTSLGMNVSWRF